MNLKEITTKFLSEVPNLIHQLVKDIHKNTISSNPPVSGLLENLQGLGIIPKKNRLN